MHNAKEELAPTASLSLSAQMFTVKPREETVQEVSTEVGDRVGAAAEALPGRFRLDSRRARLLREAVARQLHIVLTGDYDAWLERALEYGPPEQILPEKATDAEYREIWERCASKLRLAPLSIDHVAVRPLWLRGERIEHAAAQAMFRAWPSLSARYPKKDPKAHRLDVYEALIPLYYTSAESTEPDTPIVLGVSFWWDEAHGRWTPFDLVGFADSLDRTMSAMIF
ncbi:MAG: hypothetical protein D6824_07595 [Planctomycetota bacterium]|nr:MAG: hypothetical protein D6824_07595 [Planctomycetota bacterium]